MNNSMAIARHRVSISDYMILVLSILIVSITSNYMASFTITLPSINRTAKANTDNSVQKTIQVTTVIPDTASDSIKTAITDEKRTLMTLESKVNKEIHNEEVAAVKKYIASIVCDPNDVSKVSNLKAEDMKLLTKGTWWEGNEQALIDLEKNHHVNAMFAMSVSSLESGRGTSPRCKAKKNFYGMEIDKTFYGLYDCTQYWGDLIDETYVSKWNKESVWEIGPTYCPPNREWESYMNAQMISFYNGLINNMEATLI